MEINGAYKKTDINCKQLDLLYLFQKKYYQLELQVLGCSPKEWALNMVREDCELDTLALIAIRNMLDVSLLNLLKLIAIVDFVTHAIRKPGNLETFQVRYPKTVQCVIRKCCCRFLCVLLDQVNNPRHFLRGSCQHLVDTLYI